MCHSSPVSVNIKNTLARAKANTVAPIIKDVEEVTQRNAVLQAKLNELQNQLDDKKRFEAVKARALLEAAVEKHGIEPCDELLRMVVDGEVTTSQKIQILMELNSFRIPKMKTSEIKHQHDYQFTVGIQTFTPGGREEIVDVTPRQSVIEG